MIRGAPIKLNPPPVSSPRQSQNPKPHQFQLQSHEYSSACGSTSDPDEISPSAKLLHQLLLSASPSRPDDLEAALSSTGIPPTLEVTEQVLKLSYNNPSTAVEFFRWAGRAHKPTSYAWNLMVDILGKNRLFEPMWDAVRSMKQDQVLSVGTFASVFSSYCAAGRPNEAIMSFNVMEKYDVQQDVVAVNSLLSAICRDANQTLVAAEFFETIKSNIPPDGDTFAILLEGWEKEGNAAKAKNTFGEMVVRIGWSPQYMLAYDALLLTLIRASHADEALKFLQVMKGKDCLPGLKFFSNALDVLVKQNDSAHAVPVWDIMVGSGLIPNLIMYNAMIRLLCNNNDIDNGFRLLDEMVFHGAFPDFLSYNTIFRCLVKNKKVQEAGKFFYEMIKNESPPTHVDCAAAITMFINSYDPEMAIEIWNYMVENCVSPLDESANALLNGLHNVGRLSEVWRFAGDMLDRRINIHESTMEKLKNAVNKEGRNAREMYDSLERRWKSS